MYLKLSSVLGEDFNLVFVDRHKKAKTESLRSLYFAAKQFTHLAFASEHSKDDIGLMAVLAEDIRSLFVEVVVATKPKKKTLSSQNSSGQKCPDSVTNEGEEPKIHVFCKLHHLQVN